MKTRVIALVLAAIMVLGGCSSVSAPEQERYEATFMTLFDTVTKIVGYAESEEAFQATAQEIHDELLEYHQLYDIYKDYDGINNIKTINDCAGGEPVAVDQRVIDLLLFCRELYEATEGRVNTAMGSVLSLWHDARNAGIDDPENSALPEADALNKAAEHTGFEAIVIDEKAGNHPDNGSGGSAGCGSYRKRLRGSANCRSVSFRPSHQCRRKCLCNRAETGGRKSVGCRS